jgi:hypothetical protein
MQRTADFHDQIAGTGLAQAVGLVDDAATLDAPVAVLDAHTPSRDPPICGFLRARQGPASRLAGRHDDLAPVENERQKAQILEQPAPRRQGGGGRLGKPLIVGAAGIGVTPKADRERGIDQQHVVDRVALLLATITARLLSGILGARDAPFGAIVPTRGEAGAGAGAAAGGSGGGEGPSVGTTRAAALASATPRRGANPCTDRLGAAPRARSVVRSTTKRTGIHCWALLWLIPNSRPCTTWSG